ncbi:formate dehydrogenase subunit delta [Jiella sp. MQZ9-1]|uniref:Formate dehydrogenase subunit delta n=1 Tax=Jiella flava TaxID=2816857 RepID=A0A939G1F1_9HYPH|nr:formate dehydrogenase subunit delta [Jiella flava]MBO0663269.1 formate dehydrogenase subunit delta [Jiella flava]MCD2471845.1 formate dehydrogenase subunit delta [Jiella flava]
MERDKLVYMANQIAKFFESSPEGARSQGVADHINKFWEPRMRTQLFERFDEGRTEGMHPLVIEAQPEIRRPAAPLEARTTSQQDASAS